MFKKLLFLVTFCFFHFNSPQHILAQCIDLSPSICDTDLVKFKYNTTLSNYIVQYCTAYRESDGTIVNLSDWKEKTAVNDADDNKVISIYPKWVESAQIYYNRINHPSLDVVLFNYFSICELTITPDRTPVLLLYTSNCSVQNLHIIESYCCANSGRTSSPTGGTGIQPTVIDIQGIDPNCDFPDPSCFNGGKTARTTALNNVVTLSNYPNPFSSHTNLQYQLPEQAKVSLYVFDIQGRLVSRLVDQQQQKAGKYQQLWQTQQLSPGIYYYQLLVDNVIYTDKIIKM